MSASTDNVPCGLCGAANPPMHAYCGACGGTLPVSRPPTVAASHRRYRGPRRMLVVSGLLFVVSALVAIGAFLAIQANGASGIATDLGGPVINAVLNSLGIKWVSAPQGGGASLLLVAAFLLGFIVALVNLLLLIAGSVWLLTRWASRDREVSDRGPVVAQAAAAGRRQAAAARERGSDGYAKAKPKLVEVARKGRKTFDDEVKPRVAASAEKAAATGRRQYAEGKPRLAETAQKGRKAFDDDVKPRVAAGTGKAVAKGRQLLAGRRSRPPRGD